jgi:hypothetical protein
VTRLVVLAALCFAAAQTEAHDVTAVKPEIDAWSPARGPTWAVEYRPDTPTGPAGRRCFGGHGETTRTGNDVRGLLSSNGGGWISVAGEVAADGSIRLGSARSTATSAHFEGSIDDERGYGTWAERGGCHGWWRSWVVPDLPEPP